MREEIMDKVMVSFSEGYLEVPTGKGVAIGTHDSEAVGMIEFQGG